MEYCESGDLRRLLNKIENCRGNKDFRASCCFDVDRYVFFVGFTFSRGIKGFEDLSRFLNVFENYFCFLGVCSSYVRLVFLSEKYSHVQDYLNILMFSGKI